MKMKLWMKFNCCQTQLKYILSLVIQQRKGYKLRENRFAYATGIGVKNPYARNIHSTMDITTERYLRIVCLI